MKQNKSILLYQTKAGAIEITVDAKQETFLLTQQQVAQLFDVQKAAISKHVKSIFESEELTKRATVSILETVQKEGKREVKRSVEVYNLDLVLSIGYRVNSVKATRFRQWATKTLHKHIVDGYTLNRARIEKNYQKFLKAVETVQKLSLPSAGVGVGDAMELVRLFASTWFSLDAYDKAQLPSTGDTQKDVQMTAQEFADALRALKTELIKKGEATELFACERNKGSLEGIVGNVFQAFGGKELYASAEEKAAHLLYFVVKNHPFVDGNKRSGAFAFVWFLRRAGLLNPAQLTPEALTALTLLVAESNPKEKNRMVGLILLLLD